MSAKLPLWRSRLFLGCLGLSGAAGAVFCLLPLFETPGYELSLLAALVCSLATGAVAAVYPDRVRRQLAPFPGATAPALVLYARVLGAGLVITAAPLVVSLVNGLRVPFCNLSSGLAFYGLMPVSGTAAAAAAGLLIGLVTPGPRSALLGWVICFAASLAAALLRFHDTPAVNLFGPFFGYFPGVLYDELVAVEARLITYRLITLVDIGMALAAAHWLIDPAALRLDPRRIRSHPWRAACALYLLLAAIALYQLGPALGHRTERIDLEDALPNRWPTEGLELFFAPDAPVDLTHSLVFETRYALSEVERYLGIEAERPIAVFFFDDEAERRAVMGAGKTNVAKPWRSEVYLTLAEPPHPVLRHELAHAVAAKLGRGPFAVPGAFGGLLPDPGLIEGLATAAEGPRGDRTLHEWAAAMERLHILPSLFRVFGVGFFDLTAAAAYVAAGSFVQFVVDVHGTAALRKVYATRDWRSATGADLATLEKRWREALRAVPLSEADLLAAKDRFARPPILRSVCVHEVARLRARAKDRAGRGCFGDAVRSYEMAYWRSGKSPLALRDVLGALADDGKDEREIRALASEVVASPAFGRAVKADALEIVADLDTADGNLAAAGRAFASLAARAGDADDRRRLEVKAHLACLPPNPFTPRLLDLLARRPGSRAVSPALAGLLIADAAHALPGDPILAYLHGRQYCNQHEWAPAAARLRDALDLGLAARSPSLALANRMLGAEALFHLGRLQTAEAAFRALAADAALPAGARAAAADWVARCRFAAQVSR